MDDGRPIVPPLSKYVVPAIIVPCRVWAIVDWPDDHRHTLGDLLRWSAGNESRRARVMRSVRDAFADWCAMRGLS